VELFVILKECIEVTGLSAKESPINWSVWPVSGHAEARRLVRSLESQRSKQLSHHRDVDQVFIVNNVTDKVLAD
jgi:hypothetical protein